MTKTSSLERMLDVFTLFSDEHASCTPERAAEALGTSRSTTYRYFKMLTDAGLLVLQARGSYVLGPAIIEYDRLIRHHDPLLELSRPILRDLIARTDAEALLARLYRDRVVCIHREFNPPGYEVTYERGRPMSLLRTATARVMLAHLPARQLRRLFEARQPEIRHSNLGSTWVKFTANLRAVREAGYYTIMDGVDKGFSGVAAAIMGPTGEADTSLSLVLRTEVLRDRGDAQFASLVMRCARMISAAIANPGAGR